MVIPTRSFFGVQENLLKLSELDTIYVDGTFSTSSFPILPALHNQAVPSGIRIPPYTKSWVDYNRFFTIVKEEMHNSGLTLQPSAVMAAFYLALIH